MNFLLVPFVAAWRWVIGERTYEHRLYADWPEMARVRRVMRWPVGLWLAFSAVMAVQGADFWFGSFLGVLVALSMLACGLLVLMFIAEAWRNWIIAHLKP